MSDIYRQFSEDCLLVASHNDGKVKEIAALLKPLKISIMSSKQLGLPEPIEDGKTFIDNAVLKARSACENSKLPSLADDSGLAVSALAGRPGIFSARWAETATGRNFQKAIYKVHREMGQREDRSAEFICALALCWPDGHIECFQGKICGTIVWPPRGTTGFGYDPIFQAIGDNVTFSEIDPIEKQKKSHRAIAFNKMVDACFNLPDG